jgi:hypothetical protein
VKRLVVRDAINREQAFNPVDVLDSFADQPATLTMEPTVVLFGDTRRAQNAPNLWLTTQIRHQRSEQSLDINSVRLGSARPTINRHTRRLPLPSVTRQDGPSSSVTAAAASRCARR